MLTTFMCMGIVSIILTAMMNSSQQRKFQTTYTKNKLKSEAYAEAGFEHAMAMLKGNDGWENRSNPLACIPKNLQLSSMQTIKSGNSYTIKDVNHAEGSYDLTLTPSETSQYCVISTVGKCGNSTSEVKVLLEDYAYDSRENSESNSTEPTNATTAPSAWDYTICAIGQMFLRGNGDIDGSLHANQLLRLNGNVEIGPSAVNMSSSSQIRINGNVKANGTFIAPNISVSGNKESGASFSVADVPAVAFPEYDLDELYDTALANGQVIKGNLKKSKDLNLSNIPGNVVWVTGYVKISANANINCTLVSEGYIRITGNCNWDEGHSTQNHIISKSDDIKIAGNTEVCGLLYTPGAVDISGNARIKGQIISGQDINIRGNVDFCNFTYSGPTSASNTLPPPMEPENPYKVAIGISAWQK